MDGVGSDECEGMGDERGCVGEVWAGTVITVFGSVGALPESVVPCRAKYATASESVTGSKTFSLSPHQRNQPSRKERLTR